MNSKQNNNNYISCPVCMTLFRSKIDKQLSNNQFTCICCGSIFKPKDEKEIQSSSRQPNNHEIIANTLKYQARVQNKIVDQLPITVEVQNKKTTDSYLKIYKLKSKILLITWILIPLIIVATLITTILAYKNDLAQNYEWRDYMIQFCNLLNCELQPYNNPEHLVIEDNTMVTANNQPNTIQLLAMLNNTAKFDQQFPNLEIKFTDLNGKLIKHQTISPEQYIENYNQSNNIIAKNSKQYISVLIDDPGVEAINYELIISSS